MSGMATHVVAAAAASQPSWLWYATRGLGAATLVVLTCSVVLGIVTATRWIGESTPGFVVADVHRNLSLLALGLLFAHIVTTVLDPFAHISLRDVIVPFGAQYRPIWLGLGVAAAEVMVALAVTSMLRDRIGPRAWRFIHWGAYASWPLAVIHGVGTGSDSRSPWLIGVVVSCVAAVLLALVQRLREGGPSTVPIRVGATLAIGLFIGASTGWAFNGPFQADWSAKAGTPPVKKTPGPVHPGPSGFSDPLVGVLVRDKAGNVEISMRDTIDTQLTLSVRSPNETETLPVVTVSRGTRVLCTVPASVGSSLYAVCGTTRLTVTFFGSPDAVANGGSITGRLDTSGPLN